MLTVIEHGLRDFGRLPKLSRADQLLMPLMYWREYRTEFHIGLAYGASESSEGSQSRLIPRTDSD